MKVKDLVEKLQKFQPDAEIMVLQKVPGSHHYSDNGEPEYGLSHEFKVRIIADDWIELV